MQTSKRVVNKTLERQLAQTVYQLVTDIKNTNNAEAVLSTILSPVELSTVIKRVSIAYWLSKGRKYENIKNNLKVSSASISEIQKQIKKPGWQLTLKYLSADEWATVWEEKIRKFLPK
jgi:uncharacterized protein YerC